MTCCFELAGIQSRLKGDYAKDNLFSYQTHPSAAQNLQVKRPPDCTGTWTPPPLVVAPLRIPCKSSWGHNRAFLFLIENETTQSYQPANARKSDHFLLGVNSPTLHTLDMQVWFQKQNKGSEQIFVPNFLPKSFSNTANLVTKLPFLSLISVP